MPKDCLTHTFVDILLCTRSPDVCLFRPKVIENLDTNFHLKKVYLYENERVYNGCFVIITPVKFVLEKMFGWLGLCFTMRSSRVLKFSRYRQTPLAKFPSIFSLNGSPV